MRLSDLSLKGKLPNIWGEAAPEAPTYRLEEGGRGFYVSKTYIATILFSPVILRTVGAEDDHLEPQDLEDSSLEEFKVDSNGRYGFNVDKLDSRFPKEIYESISKMGIGEKILLQQQQERERQSERGFTNTQEDRKLFVIKLTAITDVELLRILLPLKHVRRILNDIPSAKVSVRGTQEDAGHTLVAVDWHKAERPEVWGFDTEAIKRRAEVIRYGGNEMSAQAYADTKNRFSELAKGIEDDMIRRALQMVLDDALESETKEDLWIEKRWIGRRVG
ncbi:MAG: hypothetical protein MMC23_006306 [Stictis urceolatum]|nr:hypothetical protein [Stictis urceolata]